MAKTLTDLFINELQDAYNAETQLTKALPKLAKAAVSSDLRGGFELHLKETENQIERLEQVFEQIGAKASSHTCKAMKGIVAEGEEIMDLGLDKDSRDAGLIAAAQKAEHYEIALYGTLCAFAKQLGHTEAASLLHQTLEEEKRTDEKLSQLAKRSANPRADK